MLFKSDILLYLWCGVTAAQDMQLSSSASVHGRHKIGKNPLFPIPERWVSCGSWALRIPPPNKYWKKKIVYTLSLLPSDSNVTLSSNVYPSEEHGKLEMFWFFFFGVSNNTNLTFLLFLISPSDDGTERRIYPELSTWKAACLVIVGTTICPNKQLLWATGTAPASTAGTLAAHSSAFLFKKNPKRYP